MMLCELNGCHVPPCLRRRARGPLSQGVSYHVTVNPLNGSWLALFGRESLAEDAGISPEGSGFAGVTIAHNLESEAAVDAIIDQAVTAGAGLVKPAQKVFWGGYSGYFADPDDYLWEIAHNPLFWVGPKDGEHES